MRSSPVLTAAAIGLAATISLASAQATNVQKRSGNAPTIGNTQDSMSKSTMKQSKKTKKSKSKSSKSKKMQSTT